MKWRVYGGKSLERDDWSVLGLYEADTGSEAIRKCLEANAGARDDVLMAEPVKPEDKKEKVTP